MSEPLLIIGDFPFIFRKQIELFSEFNDHDILFALSNRRIYTTSKKPISNFSHKSALSYNALVILHSVKYVATSDLKILKVSIELFKRIEIENVEDFYKIAFCELYQE